MSDGPAEVLTLFHCPGCEMNGFVGDAKPCDHPQAEKGDQLRCHRCGTRLSAVNFHDYVDTRVVEYAE
jgi:hypothetical protein